MQKIIKRSRSIIPACDVSLEIYEKVVKETANIKEVGGYKIGFVLGLIYGLPKIVQITKRYTNKPIIYDHQKACTDIPDTGKKFAEVCKSAGIDVVILFPQSGPETEKKWIESCKEEGLEIIVGGLMSHPAYIRREGGFLADDAILEIYMLAADLGVVDFVVPGNRIDDVSLIRKALRKKNVKANFYSPGLVAQGGNIRQMSGFFNGDNWHAIVGRGIYEAKDIKRATCKYARLL